MFNSSHLKALIKKNLLVYKSTFILTLIELLFPILVIFLFWKLRAFFKIEQFTIEDDEAYYFGEGILITDFNDFNDDINKAHSKYLFSSSPFYNFCLFGNKFIAILGNNLTINISYLFYEYETEIKYYSSLKELYDYIESPDYGKDDFHKEICFGITYSYNKNKYNFKFHYFASEYERYHPEIPSTWKQNLDPFATQPDFDSYTKYAFGEFLSTQKLIYDIILKRETNESMGEITFRIIPQKYEKFIDDSFHLFFKYMLGFCMIIAYSLPLTINLYRLVKEKESRVKEGMKIMGLKETAYFLSYFIIYLFINLFYAICNTFLLNKGMVYVEKLYIFIFLYLFGLVIYSLIYFFQSFLERTRLAIIVSLLIYSLMYFFSFCFNTSIPKRIFKIIFCILFPPITMQLGINTFAKFESNFNKFNGRIYMKHHNFCIFDVYILFIVDFFLYMFLGFYLQNIISHEFGLNKKFDFLFTSSYWGVGKQERDNNININYEIGNKFQLNILKEPKNESISKQVIKNSSTPSSNNKDTDKSRTNLIKSSNDIYINIQNNKPQIKNESKINGDINNFINIKNKSEISIEEEDFFEFNPFYKDIVNPKDILQIKQIRKIFDDNKIALKGVSFNLYRNEIFVLLGHNGAGKSTLINILTGLYPSTSGEAYYNSYNILSPEGIEKFRKELGICPQHDVLFNELTVEEHLEMFCIFKSVDKSKIKSEITKIIHDVGLEEKRYTKVKNLSGGQKRKLSISIALVGGSSVIFLDEPTSGMDITSRRNLWNVLKRCIKGKIIILTTHYMEEASVLGNRIGILSEGEMKCSGSPLFLIEKFGKNMNINITKKKEANNNEIIEFIKNNSGINENIEYEIFSEEILFKIPKDENFFGKQLFNELDKNLDLLKIKSYSISMPTLEDVFINLSKIIKRKKMTKEQYEQDEIKNKEILEKNNFILYDNNNYNMKYSCCSKILRDLKISFKKRLFQVYRDKKTVFLEIICPILLVLIGCIVGSIDLLEKNKTFPFHINQITNDSQTILYSSTVDNIGLDTINEIVSNYSSEDISKVKFEYIDFNTTNDQEADDIEFMQTIYEKKYIKKEVKNNYGAYLLTKIDELNHNYEFSVFPDIISRQSTPIYANYMLNNLVRYAAKNKNLEIEIINEPLPYTMKEKMDKQERNRIIVLFFISISFSLIPANFITVIIKERENNSKHLQIISGISLFSYWLNNYIFELIKYYVIGGICIFIIYLFDYYKQYLSILYLEYGPAMVSFTYLFSFIFKSEDKGQTFVLLINLLFGTLGANIVLTMRFENKLEVKAKKMAYIFRIIPSFSFCYGYNILLNEEYLKYIDYNIKSIFDLQFITSDFIYLGAESIIYLLILIFFENSNKIFRPFYTLKKSERKNIKNKNNIEICENQINELNISIPDNVNDSYVKNEIIKANNSENKENYAMKIQGLIKTFYGGPFGFKIFSRFFKSTNAIRNISFCLEYGECFGFLGINGAGKTTTFKCLSNEIFPTSGNIFIDNKNINKDFENIRSLIGYCPQFDAIFEFLTVYENLEFYGLIKGAKREKLNYIIDALIEEINLLPFKNKVAGKLSGGNKRKLSVAIALICNPPIILLDEPSTGMDPEARRFMWGVIHRVSLNQKKSTIIMTTHSMEEAETLCKRIGILVDGQFKCLSTSDEIKEKYGYGYEINLQIKKPDANELYEIYQIRDCHKNKDISLNNLEVLSKLYYFEQYYELIRNDFFWKKILEEFKIYNKISFNKILYLIYYVNKVFNFVNIILDNFEEICCIDYSDNNFIITIKKEKNKSIGFLYGLIEDNKQKFNIEQYNLKLTSLEQIFNKFAKEKEKTSNEINNNENSDINIKITKELVGKLYMNHPLGLLTASAFGLSKSTTCKSK